MTACPHDCYLCVAEARCDLDHLAALKVCDRCIWRISLPYVTRADSTLAGAVGYVMRMTGGRANPRRVAEIVREKGIG